MADFTLRVSLFAKLRRRSPRRGPDGWLPILAGLALVLGTPAWWLASAQAQNPGSFQQPGGFSGPGQPGFGPGSFPGSGQPGPFAGPGQPTLPQVQPAPVPSLPPPPAPFGFKFDDNTPLKDLLPEPPQNQGELAPFLDNDLTQVPLIMFGQSPISKNPANPAEKALVELEQTAHQMAKIKHVNKKGTDAFLKALIANRPDLGGVPFLMGDACRKNQEQSNDFAMAVTVVRQLMQQSFNITIENAAAAPKLAADAFWANMKAPWTTVGLTNAKEWDRLQPSITAVLIQVLAHQTPEMRLGLVKHLSQVPSVEATRALAKMAVFSPEKEIQQAAVNALKIRREKDYTDILLAGLKYPMPAVAQRSASAMVTLECTTVVPELVRLLDERDPRLPVTKKVAGKEVHEVRQMVKLNHNQNCMLCHPPADAATPGAVITAQVPLPTQPLPSFSQGYGNSQPDILVRIDATYLRPDFSMLQTVKDAAPWPEKQRFDFLVRTVKLTPAQAKAFEQKLAPQAGATTPYQQALLVALRGLTGQDAAPNSGAWKQALKPPG